MDRHPEILAPVGTEEALIAAVRSGADAVYFGTGECNARRFAGRFEGEALDQAVSYCHARNVKVYLTVNTLLRDEELKNLIATLEQIGKSGADGLIIQDLAVAQLAKQICPSLERHASTQMAVHNVTGVRQLEEMGFSRIVLARELSLSEIRTVCQETGAEIEVFVHGALCMSASGMCYFSASLGERSGNRGTCAQPCRLPFACGTNPYCLSLKDMSCLSMLPELKEAGVSSFKIEGRMKRPEYVAAAVHAALCAREGNSYETESLQTVFSRSGFTDGYLTAHRDRRMFGIRTQEDAQQSQKILGTFRDLYRTERSNVPVTAHICLNREKPVELTVTDGNNQIKVLGDIPQKAERIAADRDYLSRFLQKTGGTPFQMESVTADLDEDLMIAGSEINRIRREALDQLLRVRERLKEHPISVFPFEPHRQGRHCTHPQYRVRFAKRSQVFTQKEMASYSLPIGELIRMDGFLNASVWCELPELIYPEQEATVFAQLQSLKARGITDAVCGNIGSIRLAKEAGLLVHGSYALNVTNTLAADAYHQLGLQDLTLSFELPYAKMRDLYAEIPLGCLVTGYLPLMQFRSCPARTEKGCATCDGHPTITDRKGKSFPIQCHGRQYSTMLNSVLYYAADKPLPELDFYVLYFTTETKEEGKKLFQTVLNHEKPQMERTTGMSFRTLL